MPEEKLKSCGPHPFWVSLLSFFPCQEEEEGLTFSYTSLFLYSLKPNTKYSVSEFNKHRNMFKYLHFFQKNEEVWKEVSNVSQGT